MATIRRPIPDYEEVMAEREIEESRERARKLKEKKEKEEEERRKKETEKRKKKVRDERRKRIRDLEEEVMERERIIQLEELKARLEHVEITNGKLLVPYEKEEDVSELIKGESAKVTEVYARFYSALDDILNDQDFLDKLQGTEKIRYELAEVFEYADDHDELPKDDRLSMLLKKCGETDYISKIVGNPDVLFLVAYKIQNKRKINMDICEYYKPNELRLYRYLANEETGGLYSVCTAGEPAMTVCNGSWKSVCDSRRKHTSEISQKLIEGKLL